jgi:hypothetical protein
MDSERQVAGTAGKEVMLADLEESRAAESG